MVAGCCTLRNAVRVLSIRIELHREAHLSARGHRTQNTIRREQYISTMPEPIKANSREGPVQTHRLVLAVAG